MLGTMLGTRLKAFLEMTIQARIRENPNSPKSVKPREGRPTAQHESQECEAVTSEVQSLQLGPVESAEGKEVRGQPDSDDEDWQPY